MKYYILCLSLFISYAVWSQGKPAIYYIDITDENGLVRTIRQANNEILRGENPDLVSFRENGGTLIIKNSSTNPRKIQLFIRSENGGKDRIIIPKEIASGSEESFPFSKEGKIQSNLLIAGKENTSIDQVVVEVTDEQNSTIGNPITLNNLLASNIRKEEKHQHSQACNECTDIDNYDKNFIYYDFTCKCFYTYRIKKNSKTVKDTVRTTKIIKDTTGRTLSIEETIKEVKNKKIAVKDTVRKKLNLARLKLVPNQELQFKVVGVNRYIYNVGIESTQVDYESEMPPLLRQLFIGDTTGLLGNLLRAFSTLPTGPQSLREKEDLAVKYENFLEALIKFNENYAQLQAAKYDAYKACFAFPCCGVDKINVTLKELLTDLANLRIALLELQLEAASEDAIKARKTELENDRKKLEAKREAAKKVADLKAELNSVSDATKRQQIEASIATEQKNAEGEAELLADIAEKESLLRVFSNIRNLQLSLPNEETLSRLFLFVDNIRNQHSRFLTPPIYANGNRLELLFKFIPRDTVIVPNQALMPLERDSVYYDIPVLRKPFISFSSGSFFVPQRWLDNKTYAWQRVPDNNYVGDSLLYTIAESGYTGRPLGFSAFLNLEWKVTRNIGIGPSMGVGITIESKPRMTYLTGLSLFFGDLKQLGITGGLAGMNVNRLANNWQAVADQKIRYKTSSALDYYKEFRTGMFVSVTYTPFNISKRPLLKDIKNTQR